MWTSRQEFAATLSAWHASAMSRGLFLVSWMALAACFGAGCLDFSQEKFAFRCEEEGCSQAEASGDGGTLDASVSTNDGGSAGDSGVDAGQSDASSERWKQLDELNVGAGDAGFSLAMSADGENLAVGVPAHSDKGAVFTYSWNNNRWDLGQSIPAVLPAFECGRSVALSGDGRFLYVGCSLGNSGIEVQGRVIRYPNPYQGSVSDIKSKDGLGFSTTFATNHDGRLVIIGGSIGAFRWNPDNDSSSSLNSSIGVDVQRVGVSKNSDTIVWAFDNSVSVYGPQNGPMQYLTRRHLFALSMGGKVVAVQPFENKVDLVYPFSGGSPRQISITGQVATALALNGEGNVLAVLVGGELSIYTVNQDSTVSSGPFTTGGTLLAINEDGTKIVVGNQLAGTVTTFVRGSP